MLATPPKKAFTKVYTIWDTVRPFHIAMKLSGYASFSLDGDFASGQLKMTFADSILFLIINCITIALIYLNWMTDLSLISSNSKVIAICSRFVLLFEISNVFVSIISMFFRREIVWGIFRRCHQFDVEMRSFKMFLDHKKYLKIFIFIAIGMMVVFLSMTGGSNYIMFITIPPNLSIYIMISYMAINASMSVSLMAIAFTLYAIYLRFKLINETIRKFFVTEEEDEPRPQKSSDVSCKIIAKMADQHDSLVDIVNLFNKCFSFQLMNVVAAMFLTNIFSVFAVYRVFVKNDYGQYERALVQYSWNLYFLAFGFVIVSIASLVTRTGKYTAVLVHKVVNYIDDDDDPIIDYLKMFSQQMQHRAPVVTCGLFTFDFTLVFTIIGATATYIVILIQFDTDNPIAAKNMTLPLTNFTS